MVIDISYIILYESIFYVFYSCLFKAGGIYIIRSRKGSGKHDFIFTY